MPIHRISTIYNSHNSIGRNVQRYNVRPKSVGICRSGKGSDPEQGKDGQKLNPELQLLIDLIVQCV